MKKLSRKWLILEHYVQTAEVMMDGCTVRVWKPKTMGKLPAIEMLGLMRGHSRRFDTYSGGSVVWGTAHPDFGYWDSQIVCCEDPHRKVVDIYICALLIRPFSEEARKHYAERSGLEAWDRMLLMWDSRQFDAEGGYKPSPSGGIGIDNFPRSAEEILHVINKNEDIEDSTM